MKLFILLICVLTKILAVAAELKIPTTDDLKNSNETLLHRNKRFLVYTNGGIMKFVTGYLGPIDTPIWQNIKCIRNFQYQFALPPNIVTKFSTFPGITRSEGRGLTNIENNAEKFKPDGTRQIAYELLEHTLNREGKNGKECLRRTICEVAETPLSHNGLIGAFLQVLFTPGKFEKIDQDYVDAMKAGINRIDCLKMYPDCPFGNGLLDTMSIIEDFHFKELFLQI